MFRIDPAAKPLYDINQIKRLLPHRPPFLLVDKVMHLDSEEHDENVITQVFQKGFKMGDKIVRFAMVQVAN